MESAAKRVKYAAQRLLPERPHHLALHPDRKYPVPPNFWHHPSRLQYSTFLSDADRGLLLTRPYYDIREEPEVPPNNSSQANSKIEPKKMVNKMSFKDYQKQKKVSLSPNGNGVPGKADAKKAPGDDPRTAKEATRQELSKPKEAANPRDSKAQEVRSNGDADKLPKSLPPKTMTTKHAPSPSSENRKRAMEADDKDRPQKRPKPDEPSRVDMGRNPARADTPRNKEQNSSHDKSASRDGKSHPGSRSALGIALGGGKDSHRVVSPKITVNGVKAHSSSSSRSTPKKADTSGKHFVPPLLSPLRLSLDEEHEDKRVARKRPPETTSSGKSQPKPHKSEAPAKKHKSPITIPPLLSPTLPAIVEEALARMQKTPSKSDSSQPSSQASDSPGSARKPRARTDDSNEQDNGKLPDRLIVTLKYRKSERKTVQRLLALPSKNMIRKERSVSAEGTPPPIKKRPRPPESTAEQHVSTAPKRLKTDDSSKRLKTDNMPSSKRPFTPPKSIAIASQAPSGHAQTQTPRVRMDHTPGAVDGEPGAGEANIQARLALLYRRQRKYSSLGTEIKHRRDKLLRDQSNMHDSGASNSSDAGQNKQIALLMEMLMAYMIGFKALNQMKELERRPWEVVPWHQLQPHLDGLKNLTRHSTPLHVLALQLNGICVNEMLQAYTHQGPRGGLGELDPKQISQLLRAVQQQADVGLAAEELRSSIADEGLKTSEMGPWTSPINAASEILPMMVRWAKRERVDWAAELVVPHDS